MDLNTYTPACLAQTHDIGRFDGKEATVAGWGGLHEGGPRPSNPFAPREVQVPVITPVQCEKLGGELYNKTYLLDVIADICTQRDGKDSCSVQIF